MKGVDDVSDFVHRVIVLGIIFYFALLAYAILSNDPIARDATDFVFGAIAVGVGTALYLQNDDDSSAITAAAVCLVTGGVSQFFFLFTQLPVFEVATSLLVFVGIGFYIYAVWYAQ